VILFDCFEIQEYFTVKHADLSEAEKPGTLRLLYYDEPRLLWKKVKAYPALCGIFLPFTSIFTDRRSGREIKFGGSCILLCTS